ncbi:uncharacterized protein LOC120331004 [Styela clava]
MDVNTWNSVHLSELLSQTKCDEERLFDHDVLTSRLKRTLCYDPLKRPDMDTLSFSVTKSAVSCFRHAAPMPVGKLGHRYASRVARDACISPCALLLGLIYIERLKSRNPNYLTQISSSELFLISMMVASKYLFDEGCEDEVFNDEWAISGEMEVAKVNKLEREFLGAIDWNLYVKPHEFSSMLTIAETDVALSNGCERGWLTYSDLRSLLDCHSIYKQMTQTAGILSKATCICMIMYSGLVCLAAFTSAALVSVSQMAYQGVMPMEPQPQKLPLDTFGTHNDTDEEPLAFMQEPEENLLDAEEFPGFFPQSSVIYTNQLRSRMEGDHGSIFRGRPPSPLSQPVPLPVVDFEDTPRTTLQYGNIFTKYSTKSSHDQDVDKQYVPKVLHSKKAICTILEAFVFMTNVPMIFKDSSKPVCSSCGRPINDVASELPVCKRFDTTCPDVPSNFSNHFNAALGLKILSSRYLHHQPAKHTYQSGKNFNLTIPPSPNITPGITIVVH